MQKDTIILETIHGSRLYGLNHSGSDEDSFRVVASRPHARQFVTRDEDGNALFDTTVMGLDNFLTNVYNGSHQSCEALWSPVAYRHPTYIPLFNSLRVTGADAFARYRRTIWAFSNGTRKQRRHAVRLGYNLADLRRDGQFNPVLTSNQRQIVVVLADLYWGQSLYDIAINL